MKYLCLAYEDEGTLNALGADQWDALRRETIAYVDSLRMSGHLVLTHALQSRGTAATVRVRGGALSVTDGPFAETKDLIAGWMVIDVDTYERAVELAGELSAAPGAGGDPIYEWLEVRPFLGAPSTFTH